MLEYVLILCHKDAEMKPLSFEFSNQILYKFM